MAVFLEEPAAFLWRLLGAFLRLALVLVAWGAVLFGPLLGLLGAMAFTRQALGGPGVVLSGYARMAQPTWAAEAPAMTPEWVSVAAEAALAEGPQVALQRAAAHAAGWAGEAFVRTYLLR